MIRLFATLATLGTLGAYGVYAIYPSDHWKYSTKLTTNSFDDFIKNGVDSGKTVFVRWIASEG